MAWDSSRPVPWKRLGAYLGIYGIVMLVVLVFGRSDGTPVSAGLISVGIGLLLATAFMVTMVKLGWVAPFLRSREENAAIAAQRRQERIEAKAAKSGQPAGGSAPPVEGPRPKAVATSRTSTGMSQHPRRTTKDRRR